MQKIAIGESDFRKLRNRNNYYIDKSLFIKHILDNGSAVILITRPRRFGKTLNMSILSIFDVGKNTVENFYHAFVLGMLVVLKDSYIIK